MIMIGLRYRLRDRLRNRNRVQKNYTPLDMSIKMTLY